MTAETCTNTFACSRKWSTISLSTLDGLGGGLTFVAFPDESLRPDHRCEISASAYTDKKNISVTVKAKWIIILGAQILQCLTII